MPLKRKSEADEIHAKPRRTTYKPVSVEQWPTTAVPDPQPTHGHNRARSDCETAGTRKRLRVESPSRSQQLTRTALDELNALTSAPSSSHLSMGSQSGRSACSDRTESLSAYDARFVDELERRRIRFADHCDVAKPRNLDEILATIDKQEETSPHLRSQAQQYRKILDTSGNEADFMQSLAPKILPIEETRLSDNECTITNQQWGRHVLHESDIRPLLAAPRPDQAFGFRARCFRVHRASTLFRQLACPAPQSSSQLHAPYFIVEAKGEQGSRLVAKRQALWAAVAMLSILMRIASAAGTIDSDFFNYVHVMSSELTNETIQVSGYWATCEEGLISFWGKTVRCWSPHDPTGESFEKAYHGINKAVMWTKRHVKHRLDNDLALLEQTLPPEITPPSSDHRSRSHKRKSPLDGERSDRSVSSLRKSFSA